MAGWPAWLAGWLGCLVSLAGWLACPVGWLAWLAWLALLIRHSCMIIIDLLVMILLFYNMPPRPSRTLPRPHEDLS